MRRMYSKEQLQKLIDEVSRLIAIEELDKVVPVPSLATAGYIMQVNNAGTGYQLKNIDELQTPLYYHPIYMIDIKETPSRFMLSCVIINQSATPFTFASFKALVETGFSLNPVSGTVVVSGTTYDLHRMYFYEEAEHVYIYGRDTSNNNIVNALEITSLWNSFTNSDIGFDDYPNKLN